MRLAVKTILASLGILANLTLQVVLADYNNSDQLNWLIKNTVKLASTEFVRGFLLGQLALVLLLFVACRFLLFRGCDTGNSPSSITITTTKTSKTKSRACGSSKNSPVMETGEWVNVLLEGLLFTPLTALLLPEKSKGHSKVQERLFTLFSNLAPIRNASGHLTISPPKRLEIKLRENSHPKIRHIHTQHRNGQKGIADCVAISVEWRDCLSVGVGVEVGVGGGEGIGVLAWLPVDLECAVEECSFTLVASIERACRNPGEHLATADPSAKQEKSSSKLSLHIQSSDDYPFVLSTKIVPEIGHNCRIRGIQRIESIIQSALKQGISKWIEEDDGGCIFEGIDVEPALESVIESIFVLGGGGLKKGK